MTTDSWIILLHQLLFQSMFFAKNVLLRRRLDKPIRGSNPEANLSIAFFVIFIGVAVWISLEPNTNRTNSLPSGAQVIAGLLMLMSLGIAAASLKDLGDSWRVGVIDEHKTELIELGVYRFSRNPYFLAYLRVFAAYTIFLQSFLLLLLSVIGFGLVHTMILREEQYLASTHAADYECYRQRVPRYLRVRKVKY